MKTSVLIVEDEALIALDLRERMLRFGYHVNGMAHSIEEARLSISRMMPDVILLDIMLQGSATGLDLARDMLAMGVPVIFITAYADDQTISRAQGCKPYGYIVKPFNDRELVAMIEITLERARYEREIKESEERHRNIVNAVSDALFITDDRDKIMEVNSAAIDLYGFSRDELITKHVTDLSIVSDNAPRAFLPLVLHKTKGGTIFSAEVVRKDFQWKGQLIYAVSVRNVGDRAVNEQALIESGRTSLLTALAAGITHEVAQPLTALSLAAETMKLLCSDTGNEALIEKCNVIEQYITRISKIIDHARGFTHAWSKKVALFSINDAIRNTLDLFGSHYRKRGIDVVTRLAEPIPQIRGNMYQFEQAVINLLSNAADALEIKGDADKKITITSDFTDQAVVFSLFDNGCGMTDDIRERLFTPYFTTKSSSHIRGTGIGLWITHAIVQSMDGSIIVESKIGSFTKFIITLPRTSIV